MKFEKMLAKNGEYTLKVNDKLVYSKYRPKQDAFNFIINEIEEAQGYLLIGLWLGYHLEALIKLVGEKKPIIVYCSKTEKDLFEENESDFCIPDNVMIVTEIEAIQFEITYQVIITKIWLSVMDSNHPLYLLILDIKNKQKTYRLYSPLLEGNFRRNIEYEDFLLKDYSNNLSNKELACLISAGPSLNKTIDWLTKVDERVFVLAVGSALKPLLNRGIQPNAVIVADPKIEIMEQIQDRNYNGLLFYLSTANHETVSIHPYKRCMLLQNGYESAEELASCINYPTLDTGGSVATIAFSLLEYLGFKRIVLFGQDLSFKGNNTHASDSTSNTDVLKGLKNAQIFSNRGELVFTSYSLLSYLNWFNRKIPDSIAEVYNTAIDGAKINSTKQLSEEQFIHLCNNTVFD
ncbi:motility associated factor glycosyltransferase family protein [Lysinibacillus sp. NPDC056232]|uniref:motility associated factor glycosyltransferase family protein n=1 Tax=Lysinibacillus sp. NPDC056232 TaxID=3345756 RepID=UPI0035D9DF2E